MKALTVYTQILFLVAGLSSMPARSFVTDDGVAARHPPNVVPDLGMTSTPVKGSACRTLLEFGTATLPTLPADTLCGYDSVNCRNSGMRHAGIDYPGTGQAIAIAAGRVVRVQALNTGDHGMGNNVIIQHTLPGPGCAVVYSSYSRLGSIAVNPGQSVAKGDVMGDLGRSGYGSPTYWPKSHLHLELKTSATQANPLGVGNQNSTCAKDPLNARANTCWGFIGSASLNKPGPDDAGYLNPERYLNTVVSLPTYQQVATGESHTCALKTDKRPVCWGLNVANALVGRKWTPPDRGFCSRL